VSVVLELQCPADDDEPQQRNMFVGDDDDPGQCVHTDQRRRNMFVGRQQQQQRREPAASRGAPVRLVVVLDVSHSMAEPHGPPSTVTTAADHTPASDSLVSTVLSVAL